MIRLTRDHPDYPRRLADMPHPPDPIWVWGTLPPPDAATVGIVGTRRLTPVGSRIARSLAMTLARAGAVIVSGLAQGIDSVAHAGALDAEGRTLAVLGEGLGWFDEHGPLRRRQLARRIRGDGALLSEYPLDIRGSEWTFPRRNKTIAALSDALVVVEAPLDSGALLTAKEATALERPVFVVPGPLDSPTWAGSNGFIATGQGLFMAGAQQVAERVGLRIGAPINEEAGRGQVADIVAAEPADADAIARALGVTVGEAATVIAEELIAGTILPTGDGRFTRR